MDLVAVPSQQHLLAVFQINLPVGQVVLQPLGPGPETVRRRGQDDGRALGLDPLRLEVKARALDLCLAPSAECGGRAKKTESTSHVMRSLGASGRSSTTTTWSRKVAT